MSTTPTRIRWTEVEKIALAQATHGYLRIYPGTRIMKAFAAAQAVLEEGRKRKILAKAEISWIDDYLVKVETDTEDNLFKSAAERDRNPEANNVFQFQAKQSPLPLDSLEQTAPPPQAPQVDLQSIPLEDLTTIWLSRFVQEHIMPNVDKIVEDVVSKKTAAMLEQIQVMQGEQGRLQIVAPRYAQRHMRRKVLILGLLGNQVTVIKQRFDKQLDLTLVGTDHNHDGLIGLAKSHDVGIVMTKFVNHSQQDQVKRNSPHAVMISGATSDLSNVLNSLVSEGKKGLDGHHYGKGQNGFQS